MAAWEGGRKDGAGRAKAVVHGVIGLIDLRREKRGCQKGRRRYRKAKRRGESGEDEQSFSYPCFFHFAIKLSRQSKVHKPHIRMSASFRFLSLPRWEGEWEGGRGTHFGSAYCSLRSQSYRSFEMASRL